MSIFGIFINYKENLENQVLNKWMDVSCCAHYILISNDKFDLKDVNF